MGEFLRFRRMVTPVLIQLLFWLGVLAVVVGGVVTIVTDNVLIGVAVLVLGPIAVRVYAELLIVLFRIHSALQDMASSLDAVAAGRGPAAGTTTGGYGGYAAPQPGPGYGGAPGGPRPPGPGAPPPPGGPTPGG